MERVFLSFLVVLVLPLNILLSYSYKSMNRKSDSNITSENHLHLTVKEEKKDFILTCERQIFAIDYIIYSDEIGTTCDTLLNFEFLTLGIYTDRASSSGLRNFFVITHPFCFTSGRYSFITGDETIHMKIYDDSVFIKVAFEALIGDVNIVEVNSEFVGKYEDSKTEISIDIKNESGNFGSITFIIYFI